MNERTNRPMGRQALPRVFKRQKKLAGPILDEATDRVRRERYPDLIPMIDIDLVIRGALIDARFAVVERRFSQATSNIAT